MSQFTGLYNEIQWSRLRNEQLLKLRRDEMNNITEKLKPDVFLIGQR